MNAKVHHTVVSNLENPHITQLSGAQVMLTVVCQAKEP